MEPSFAYLSGGRLTVRRAGQPAIEIESDFAIKAHERQVRSEELDGWKTRSGVWGSMGMETPQLAQWESARPVTIAMFKSVAPCGEPGKILYTLQIGSMGGLFRYDVEQRLEERLMHKNEFVGNDLSRHPTHEVLALSVERSEGKRCLQVGESDGRFLKTVTDGDSIDEAPAWVPDEGRRLVYQSAGIGRDQQGYSVGIGPYAVELLDMEKQDISILVEDDNTDFLQPRMTADGTLYYIRRPYKPLHRDRPSRTEVFKDFLLIPYRLMLAFFGFLNFFSTMFTGNPLTTAGGPKTNRNVDTRYLALWGHMVDTKRVLDQSKEKESAALVPKDWQLARRAADGQEKILAENVLSYDLGGNGDVIYTNGTTIFGLDAAGSRTELAKDRMIVKVVAVD
jgi:hypothetical protein